MGAQAQNVRVVGRYALYGAIAAGGMATVHLGRLLGPVGFSRTVAIKRLHAQFASDPEFVSMFLDEARLAARIRHPNVVPTLDVVATGGELFLVMEYVPGESVARLARALRDRQQTFPLRILSGIMTGVLHGLHAAHEAKDERGHPLGIVHRDVSPQNVLVGTDGVARVLDFGVAKAAGRMQTTKEGQIKGKLAYMPPEQLRGAAVNRQTDIYACGVILWEAITGQRLFAGDNEGAIVAKVLDGKFDPPSRVLGAANKRTLTDQMLRQSEALDATVLRALHMQPEMRFASAREMALEIERKCPPATASEIGDWVESIARDVLSSRAQMIADIESSASAAPASVRDENVLKMIANASSKPQAMPGESHAMTAVTRTSTMDGSGSGSQRYIAHVDGPPVTQPSSISVSSATPRDQGSGGKRAAVALLGSVAIGLVLLGGAFAVKHLRPSGAHAGEMGAASAEAAMATTTPSAAQAGATAGGAAHEPDAGSHEESATGSGVGSGATAATATATATTPATATATTTTTTTRRLPPPPPPPPKPTHTAPAVDCNPPFTFVDGIKKYKPECLGK